MGLTRLLRRRRSSISDLFFILLAILAVSYWLSRLSAPTSLRDRESLTGVQNSKIFPSSVGRIDLKQANYRNASKQILNNIILPKMTKSNFRNPALLHKLQAKTPNLIPFKMHKNFRFNSKSYTKAHLNYTLPHMKVTPGLGERGEPVHLIPEEQKLADSLFTEAAFNVYLSDRIALNRTVPDPRNPKCQYETYDKQLPTASVVIIFTNEIWSALLRTIHSVINRTPAYLLHEIILVDDFSDKDELKYHLQKYIDREFKAQLVKLVRFNERKGLIRARLAGAKLATGDVLIFLDSHCEANVQWLEPLLQRIKEKRNAVLCPIIDVIDDKTFEYYATNLEYFQIGGFTWNGHFTWIEIPEREERRKKYDIEPTRTPTMAGGLFAIDRKYFWEIGSYDSGMEIWGGENLEMSFRVWMCGGSLEIVPCSHVGHIFRSFHPYKFPGNKDTHGINTVRTVEVWMDDYKKYFYYHRPDLKGIDYGDITQRLGLKNKLKCKSFKWYLEEVYPEKFIFDKGVLAYGSVRNPISKLCLDTLNRDEDKSEALGYYDCLSSPLHEHKDLVTNQLMSLTLNGELRIEENCAEVNDDLNEDVNDEELPVIMTKCHGKGSNQKWSHKMGGPLVHVKSGRCIDVGRKKASEDAVVKPCKGGHFQIWWFENYANEPHVRVKDNPI